MDKKGFADRFKAAVRYSGVEDTQEALGKLLGVSSVMIWSYKAGEKVPRMGTALRMAEKLGVNVNWLLTGSGSMRQDTNVDPEPVSGQVPLISWVQAGGFCEAIDLMQPGDAEDWLPAMAGHGQHTYALRVRGDSMTNPIPGQRSYPEGVIIYVDPDAEVMPGKPVIAKLPDTQDVTLKIYVVDAGVAYLKPLNPQYQMIPVQPGTVFCGVVRGAYWPE